MASLASEILRRVDLNQVNKLTPEHILADPNDGSVLYEQFAKFVGVEDFWHCLISTDRSTNTPKY
jgi:hypothetical protein